VQNESKSLIRFCKTGLAIDVCNLQVYGPVTLGDYRPPFLDSIVVSSSGIKSPIKKTTRQSPKAKHQSRIDLSPYLRARRHELHCCESLKTRKYLHYSLKMLGYKWACLGRSLDSFLPNHIFKFIIHERPLLYEKIRKQMVKCPKIHQDNNI